MYKKILVVDDNPVSRELVREVLEDSNQRVLEAENGEEAVKKVFDEHPDIILLDIQLPVLDGYEVLRRIRSDPGLGKTPVIALTAYAMRQDEEKVYTAGFDAYITKPIDAAALRMQVQSMINPGT